LPAAAAATAYGWNLRMGDWPHASALLDNFI
jgi:hypothetical protein